MGRSSSPFRSAISRQVSEPVIATQPTIEPTTDQTFREANAASVAELHERLARAATGGGEQAHERQRARGKLPVRERIMRALHSASFVVASPLSREVQDLVEGCVVEVEAGTPQLVEQWPDK